MNISEGFLLGLSTGVVCLAYCGPVLVPFLMGEGRGIAKNTGTVILFLSGRLVAYILVGFLAGIVGINVIQTSTAGTDVFAIIYIVLSVLLIAYGFYRFKEVCLGQKQIQITKFYADRWPDAVPAIGGFATGLNVCPPFLLAITGAVASGTLFSSMAFFALFFAGTSVYFLPLPFIGFFRKQQVLRAVGKFAAMLAGFVYFFKGILMLVTNHSLI